MRTHRERKKMNCLELFSFATLVVLAVENCRLRPTNTVHLYIAVYCHEMLAVEELFSHLEAIILN